MMRLRASWAAFAMLSLACVAEEGLVTGRLIQVAPGEIVVRLDRAQSVSPGRHIEIRENVPGVGDVAVRGHWTVSSVRGTEVRARPSAGAGTPQLGGRARILAQGQQRPPSVFDGKRTTLATTETARTPIAPQEDMPKRIALDVALDSDLGRELAEQVRSETGFRGASELRIAREVARRRAALVAEAVRLLVANSTDGPRR